MKIGVISTHGIICGIAEYTESIVLELLKQKHEVTLFAQHINNQSQNRRVKEDINLRCLYAFFIILLGISV